MCLSQISQLNANQPTPCPFSNRHIRGRSSMWASFLNQSIFLHQPENEVLQDLLVQTEELHEIFNHFKEQYVSF
jgi:hypothetical protein